MIVIAILSAVAAVMSLAALWLAWLAWRDQRFNDEAVTKHLAFHRQLEADTKRLVRKLDAASSHAELAVLRDELAALRTELRRHATSDLLHPDREAPAQTERGA